MLEFLTCTGRLARWQDVAFLSALALSRRNYKMVEEEAEEEAKHLPRPLQSSPFIVAPTAAHLASSKNVHHFILPSAMVVAEVVANIEKLSAVARSRAYLKIRQREMLYIDRYKRKTTPGRKQSSTRLEKIYLVLYSNIDELHNIGNKYLRQPSDGFYIDLQMYRITMHFQNCTKITCSL